MLIVLDPFGKHPVVMTGSHNLGFKASNANDDNLVIVEGNAPLAAAYAINIIAIFQNYRWNAYAEAHRADPNVWHGLVDSDQWQASYLTGSQLAELKFWLGEPPPAPTAAPAAPAGTTPAPAAVNAVRTAPAVQGARKKAAPTKKAAPAKKKAAPTKKAPAKTKAAPAKKAAPTKKAPAKTKAAPKKKTPVKKTAAPARKAQVKRKR